MTLDSEGYKIDRVVFDEEQNLNSHEMDQRLKNMELVATQTSEVIAKHMNLSEEKSGEISMALIEACINAFEHSESKSEVYIHFLIDDNNLTIKVIDKGKGFDESKVKIPKIESKILSTHPIPHSLQYE